jgi:hypothetical protein
LFCVRGRSPPNSKLFHLDSYGFAWIRLAAKANS